MPALSFATATIQLGPNFVGVKLIVESPVRTIETNVRGTESVLSLANKKKKKVLVKAGKSYTARPKKK